MGEVSSQAIQMFSSVVFAALVASAVAGTRQDYSVCYKNGDHMDVSVDAAEKVIGYHMKPSDSFEEVHIMEDFDAGFGASRVDSQDGCYVRMLVNSFADQVKQIHYYAESGMDDESSSAVTAVPLENPEEEIGARLTEFCGETPVYKLVKAEEEEVKEQLQSRQVNYVYRRCVLFCLTYRCYTTTITLPTGSTVNYVWWWWG